MPAEVTGPSGGAFLSTASFTRPADTIAYTAGDVIGSASSAILAFPVIGTPGGHIQLTTCGVSIGLTSIPSGMTSLTLHLYTAVPAAISDNNAFVAVAGERDTYCGSLQFIPAVIGGGFLFNRQRYLGDHIKLAANSITLYGELVTDSGFTPTSATALTVALRCVALGV